MPPTMRWLCSLRRNARASNKTPGAKRSGLWLALVVVLVLCLTTWTGFAGPKESDQIWIATWGASPVAPLPANTTNPGFTNQTVRLVVHTSLGGNEVRVRLSNAFGTESLLIGAAHLALRSMNAATVPGTDRALTFSGSGSVTIPPGALVVSDSVKLDVPALSDLAVSLLARPHGPGDLARGSPRHELCFPAGGFHRRCGYAGRSHSHVLVLPDGCGSEGLEGQLCGGHIW